MASEGQHKDKAEAVGAVNIEEIYIRTADKNYFDLSNYVQNILIYEKYWSNMSYWQHRNFRFN